jgi:hypothetical protein
MLWPNVAHAMLFAILRGHLVMQMDDMNDEYPPIGTILLVTLGKSLYFDCFILLNETF